MYEYLQDSEFLLKLDRANVREHWGRLTLLSFAEEPIREIQGLMSSGSLSVNGSAAIRRTISLTMIANEETNNLENIDNLISINKKIKVEVGLTNPFKSYKKYGDVIWFPCGVFVIATATMSNSTTGCSISITGKDKMVLLDGSVGGMLPASTVFHQIEVEDESGKITYDYPTIRQIIREAVFHFGGEDETNIYINDIEETAKLLIKYKGTQPFYLLKDGDYFYVGAEPPNYTESAWRKYESGEDVGYKSTPFTYPGDLTMSAGQSVTNVLDKIVTTLGGNYEYFYDVYGRFIFQAKKNYLNTSYTPIQKLNGESYINFFNDSKYSYSFNDSQTLISVGKNPSYDNIKNDYICWGQKKISDSVTVGIRYHLIIDKKPALNLALMDMYKIVEDNKVVRYEFVNAGAAVPDTWIKVSSACGREWADWREELYRRAVINYQDSSYQKNVYDDELLTEWRKLYDPDNEEWTKVEDVSRKGWCPTVYNDPASLKYWLDFIDTGTAIGKYSVSEIGRRAKVNNVNEISILYQNEVPDVIYVLNSDDNKAEVAIAKENYATYGQKYCLYTPQQENYFLTSSTSASAFENIRESLYQNLTYNTSLSITCTPIYYLEPNNLVKVKDKLSNIDGDYVISQFNLPLAYNGTMSITAQEALTRV